MKHVFICLALVAGIHGPAIGGTLVLEDGQQFEAGAKVPATVVLKDGQRIEARVIWAGASGLVIRLRGPVFIPSDTIACKPRPEAPSPLNPKIEEAEYHAELKRLAMEGNKRLSQILEERAAQKRREDEAAANAAALAAEAAAREAELREKVTARLKQSTDAAMGNAIEERAREAARNKVDQILGPSAENAAKQSVIQKVQQWGK